MSTPNDPNADRAYYVHAAGRLPAWTWRELHNATVEAHGRPAVLTVEDGRRRVVIMDSVDYSRIMEAVERDARQEGGPAHA